ncbi:hypothetical protein D3C75_1087940 [compost metagenome]
MLGSRVRLPDGPVVDVPSVAVSVHPMSSPVGKQLVPGLAQDSGTSAVASPQSDQGPDTSAVGG